MKINTGVTCAILVVLLLTLANEAHGAKSCLTRSEARAAYPRAYLYWSGGPRGQRCWSDRRGRRRVVSSRALTVLAAVPPTPTQETTHIEPVLAWQPQWSWVSENAFMRVVPPTELPYSTFPPGEEPDVWPLLEPPQNTSGSVLVLMCGAMAAVFGLMFVRWHSSRIRITRLPFGVFAAL